MGLTERSFLERMELMGFTPTRTNADRIRSMTDEELAKWINKHDCHTNLYGYDPFEATFEWLKEEVTE